MKSKLNSAFNAGAHHLNIDQPYPSVELIDDNFIRSDKSNSFLSSDSFNSSSNFLGQAPPSAQLIESDLIKVNQTLKLINNSQLLKCLNRTMLNDETSSSPLDEQLSQTSNASSANAELTASKGYHLELVSLASPGDQTGQQLQNAYSYAEHSVDSPENNSSGEWNNGAQQDLDYEPQPKQRRIQTRQSTQQLLAGQFQKDSNSSTGASNLADQFSGQLSPLQQLVLAQQQLNALRGQQQQQQQQQQSAAALTNQLVSQLSTQLTKDSSDPDAMSANVALSNLLNGSMNINQFTQHLNQLNQLSQLGLTSSSSLNSSSLTSLLHNMVSNQSSSQQPSPSVVSQSNQPSSAFNISLNCNSRSSIFVLCPNFLLRMRLTILSLPVANNGSQAVSASNQPTNSVSSQSLDSSKKPFDICIVCGDKASGEFFFNPKRKKSLLCY